jgi:glycosyltransferase involved in cell wall biosynthesis
MLVHQAFATQSEPGGTRHFELGRRLVAAGQHFTVVASDVSYHTGKRVVPKPRLVTEYIEDGVRILRAFTCSGVHRSYFSRMITFLSFMITSVIVGGNAETPDVVMGTTPPLFQALSAWALSRLHDRPFLLEIRDLWPEFAIDIGLLRNPVLIYLARSIETFLYARADQLLVNSPAYRDYLIQRGADPSKIALIANGVDVSMFRPEDRGEVFRRDLGLEERFLVTYAGAIGLANNLDLLLKAAEAIKHRGDIHILIVGDGKERARLEGKSQQLQLNNVTFAGAFSKGKMPEVLAASDACVAILKNIPMFTTTYPNKVFDYMAAGRPVVLAIDGVIRDVIEAARGGIFVDPGNYQLLASAIIELADHAEMARDMGDNARDFVVRHFNRDDQARQFATLVSRVASGFSMKV